jgi:protein O-GlcNAc transferase
VTAEDANRALFFEAAALQQAGQEADAEKLYRVLLARNPRVAPAHNNLGMLLDKSGQSEEAEHCFRAALGLRPEYPEALNNLGAVLKRHYRYQEAIDCFRRALDLRADNIEALLNLASTFLEIGAADGSEELFKKVLELNPREERAHLGLARFYSDCGRIKESIDTLLNAIELGPTTAETRAALFALRQSACAWDNFYAEEAIVLDGIRGRHAGITPFVAISLSSTAEDQLQCARTYARSLSLPTRDFAGPRHQPRDKIRLGYASADFNDHPVSSLAVELFERHNRSRFDVIAYSYGRDDRSPMRLRLEKAFDRFVDVQSASEHEIAQQIRNDEIDILVDLTGYTRHVRPGIFSLRPAPIQVNFLGYPSTLGVDYMDYIIADDFVAPPEQHQFFSEKVVCLPGCYQVNSRRDIAPHTPTKNDCGLPDRGFVFCCFNKNAKITPRLFDIWMRLLQQVPQSVLWLLETNALATANLRQEAQARGIDPERLIFAPRRPIADHLARHRLADLFLDTLPYNAHTTMSDALWAGLPAVTCAGETFPGRVGGSILRAVGLDELVTVSLAQYESLAVNLARNPAALAHVKQKLGLNLQTAPLFDCDRYASGLEKAYTEMNDMQRAGQAPKAIRLPIG